MRENKVEMLSPNLQWRFCSAASHCRSRCRKTGICNPAGFQNLGKYVERASNILVAFHFLLYGEYNGPSHAEGGNAIPSDLPKAAGAHVEVVHSGKQTDNNPWSQGSIASF